MVVKELISILKKCDQDAIIKVKVEEKERFLKDIIVTKSVYLTSSIKNKIVIEG